jgi:hypothetical protein
MLRKEEEHIQILKLLAERTAAHTGPNPAEKWDKNYRT